jgi:hypothetical protein
MGDILIQFWEKSGFSQLFALNVELFGIRLPGSFIMICMPVSSCIWQSKKAMSLTC